MYKRTMIAVIAAILTAVCACSSQKPSSNGQQDTGSIEQFARNAPVAVRVANDRDSQIANALSASLEKAGLQTGDSNSRYAIIATVTLAEVTVAGSENKFASYEMEANLTDTATGDVLLPYKFNGREGHQTLSEAENRAVASIVRRISDEYPDTLETLFEE